MSHTTTCGRDHDGHGGIHHAVHGHEPRQADPPTPSVLPTQRSSPASAPPLPPLPPRRPGRAWELPQVRAALVATGLFVVAVLADLGGLPAIVMVVAYAGCYLAGGWEPALSGLRALRERTLDVDLLMVVAALGAASIGQPFDGALLIVIFATSGALEAAATKRTRDSVRSLLTLAPDRATRLLPRGEEQTVDAASLDVGDVILVRPGERIGADGTVIVGAGDVDQASITGEPLPVPRTVGDEVFAGTLNGAGMLHVRVERSAAESVIARIAALVDQAAAVKARTQLFIERVEQRYSVGVVVAALLVFAVPLAVGVPLHDALLRAMTFMIVASPCAVVLATMPPLLSAIANAGRHGVLVKDAVVMERLGTVTTVCFDKTGTLTEGAPEVTEIVPLDGIDPNALLALTAAAERPSEHPLGRALVAAARSRSLDLPDVASFESWPGVGVVAVVDGRRVEVGSPALLGAHETPLIRTAVEALEQEGHTVVVTLVDGRPAGMVGLADAPRLAARDAVHRAATLTGKTPILLTGDGAAAAARLARHVGIDDVRSSLLPEGKVDAVRGLQARGERVLVVGDGVNDAPALAAADVAAAMRGSDLALETADMVIVRDDLSTLPAAIELSRRARTVVVQNLVLAGTAIVVLVTLDLLGRLPLPLGVAGHEGSTVVVGLNGLRLLADRAWRPR